MVKAIDLGFNSLNNDKDIKKDIPIDNKIDIQPDISSTDLITKKKTDNITKKKTIQKDKQKDIIKDATPILETQSPMAALIASKKKGIGKVFVGLHLPEDVDRVLTQFKKDTDIDRSEAVSTAVRLFLNEYFDKLIV